MSDANNVVKIATCHFEKRVSKKGYDFTSIYLLTKNGVKIYLNCSNQSNKYLLDYVLKTDALV